MAQFADNRKEAASNVGNVVIERLANRVRDSIAATKTFDGFVRALGPETAQVVGELGPYGLTLIISTLPDSIFGSTVAAAVMKSAGIELATKLGDAIKQHTKEDRPKAAEEKLEELASEVAEKFRLKVDPMGNLHVPNCPQIINFERMMPRPSRKKGQPDQQAVGLPEVTIDMAISRGYSVSPCCSGDVDSTVKKQAASKGLKDENFSGRSAAYVLGSATDKQIEELTEWLEELTPAKTKKVIKGMKHLDSMQELIGLLAISRNKRIAYLSWLEEDREKAKKSLLLIAGYVAKYGKAAWSKVEGIYFSVKQWDKDNFKTLADEAEAKLRQPRKEATFRDIWRIFG